MNPKMLEILEFIKVRDRLVNYMATPMGRTIAERLYPTATGSTIKVLHGETTEAVRLAQKSRLPTLSDAKDIRPSIEHGKKGGVLEPKALIDVSETIAVIANVRRIILGQRSDAPSLTRIIEDVTTFTDITDSIAAVIDSDAKLKDDASPYLKHIRRESRVVHQRIQNFLTNTLSSPSNSDILQEPVITQRGGRYVLPIKAERRTAFPGILHDISASGATIFVEPLEIVEHGNRQRELHAEDERESRRILMEVTATIVEQATELSRAIRALARIDLTFGKAQYALDLNGIVPEMIDRPSENSLRLINARHPLLPNAAVPISLESGGANPILVITGPNTGGKTVALKTTGLLALMNQAGLHIPAEQGTRLPIFKNIVADIGDEQSIEQSLSTFSAHMTTIVDILRDTDRNCLVLLDELGSGTDPEEGSALAQAILEYLLQKRTSTIATTHHSSLKVFAEATEGVRNASTEFDPETLQPTYKVLMDVPGHSNAMSIAETLGLQQQVLEQARLHLGTPHRDLEELLRTMQADRDAIETLRKSAETSAQEAENLRASLDANIREAEEEKARATIDAQRAFLRESRALQTRLRRIRASLDNNLISSKRVPEIQKEIAEMQQQATELVTPEVETDTETDPVKLVPGQQVWLAEMGVHGTLLTPPDKDGTVEVQIGSIRARVALHDIEASSAPTVQQEERTPYISRVETPIHAPVEEISLRGMRYDAAEQLLEKTLNDAFLANAITLRIIHGKGTGTLKQMTHEMLDHHPLVESHHMAEQSNGGNGVTIARLSSHP